MSAPENPPAFPMIWNVDHWQTADGMTLRDWFAGQALAAFVAMHHGNDWGQDGKDHGPITARKAYAIADAMLIERAKS